MANLVFDQFKHPVQIAITLGEIPERPMINWEYTLPELGPSIFESEIVLIQCVHPRWRLQRLDVSDVHPAPQDHCSGGSIKLWCGHYDDGVSCSSSEHSLLDDEEAREVACLGDEDDPSGVPRWQSVRHGHSAE